MSRFIYALMEKNELGKKSPFFGDTWGTLRRVRANTRCRKTGKDYNLTVIDFDSKDMSKMGKKLKKLLGSPTVETANGFHWYFDYESKINQTQGLLPLVDIRNNGGLVFDKYWGDDNSISYIKVGEKRKMSQRLLKFLSKQSSERESADIKIYVEGVKTDDPWGKVPDGEEHKGLRMLCQESYKLGMSDDAIRNKHLEYIDNYHNRTKHELSLMEGRLAWAREKFGRGISLEGEVLEVEKYDPVVDNKIESLGLPYYMDNEYLNTEGIIKYVENSAYRAVGSRFLWLSSSGTIREFLEKDSHVFWKDIYVKVRDTEDRNRMIDNLMLVLGTETIADMHKRVQKDIQNCVKFRGQYDTLKYIVDPFGGNYLKTKDQELIICTNNLITKKPLKVVRPDLVEDYKDHFPELDEVLEWLVAVRFGADRKQSYLWLHCMSDWGKSFLFGGVLGSEGLDITAETTESELKIAMSGAPSGLTAETFTKAWILFIDEFRSAVSELKQITHSIHISPKNKPKTTVNVYAKIFASAESVDSLEGVHGADTQFINRFCKLEAKGSLVERDLYMHNMAYYKPAITWYCYQKLNALMTPYLTKNNTLDAANIAIPIGRAFRDKYKIQTTDLNDSIEEVRIIYMKNIQAILKDQNELSIEVVNPAFEINKLIDMYALNDKNELICINLGKAKEHYIYTQYDKKEGKKVAHKTAKQCILGEHAHFRIRVDVRNIRQNGYKVVM